MQTNRICHTCGTPYYYCYSCPTETRPLYHVMFCEKDCETIFNALVDYNSERKSAKEVYAEIKDLLPEDTSNYSYGCQKLLKKMYAELEEEKQKEVVEEVKEVAQPVGKVTQQPYNNKRNVQRKK